MRKLQVLIEIPPTRQNGKGKWVTGPIRVVRKNKPRNGGGVTLAELTSEGGDGVQRAQALADEKGYEVVGMK